MKGKKVLTISSQVKPYLTGTDVSEMSYRVSKTVSSSGGQIRIFMPCFGVINKRRHQLHEVIRLSGVNLVINDTDMPLMIKVASIPKERIQVYFIDNEDYFKRKFIFENSKSKPFKDNDERSMFFVKGVLETVKKLNWSPDIIHVHGWMSALLSFYLKEAYNKEPLFKNTKVIAFVYNDAFKGEFGENILEKLKQEDFSNKSLEGFSKECNYQSLMRTSVDYSDGLVIASENIEDSIRDYISESNVPTLEYSSFLDNDKAVVNFFDKFLE